MSAGYQHGPIKRCQYKETSPHHLRAEAYHPGSGTLGALGRNVKKKKEKKERKKKKKYIYIDR